MHKRVLKAWVFLLLLGLFGLGVLFTDVGEETLQGYKSLKETLLKPQVKDGVSSQNKQRVEKELFTLDTTPPLHARLSADSSKVMLSRKGGKEALKEAMQDVELLSQESLDETSQTIRAVLASEASYDVHNDILTAKEVALFRFKLPGNELPTAFPKTPPLMRGKAKSAELVIRDKAIDLTAHKVQLHELENQASLSANTLVFDGAYAFLTGDVALEHPMGKATSEKGELIYDKSGKGKGIKEAILSDDVYIYRPDGSFLSSEEVRFLGEEEKFISPGPSSLTRIDPLKESSHTLYAPGGLVLEHAKETVTFFRTPEQQIHFMDAYGEIFADHFEVKYKDKVVESMKMEGKVFLAYSRPQEEDRSYAYADTVTYDPTTQEMVMIGDRVLVYDRVNKMEVSAPKLRIRRDQATQKERIKGEGDVRFTLDEKEFDILKNKFKFDS
ncbi:MAG: hypothetical protein KDK62_06000 [Chlamydiia bacterium]|nr:hypothetical protein [Chlamydiia bacterium]